MNSKSLLLLVLLPFFSQQSLACLVQEALTDEMKSKADTVFIGEAIAYTPRPKFDLKSRAWRPVVIRFKVEKILSGAKQQHIEVYWINGTFGEPLTLEEFKKAFGNRTRVGITAKGSSEAKEFKDKPWIIQGPCTPPYLSVEK